MNQMEMVVAMILVLVAVLVSGCSSSPGPIVDTQGVDMSRYYADMSDCKGYGDQVEIEVGMAKGAVAGGATGAAAGAVLSESVGEWGGVGAVYGAAKSGIKGDREKSQVVKRCMRGRGYRVLN
jgi:hypothetical protein